MKTISVPYHTSHMEVEIAESNLQAVICAAEEAGTPEKSEKEIVRDALRNPIGTRPLRELAAGKKRVLIVTSDHTRPMPSGITIPLLLEEIRNGNPAAEISILIATGLHRATTEEEQRERFGDAVVENERILVNDSEKEEDFEYVCTLPSGAEFHVNRAALSCDLLITEGFIEPHFFAGFSGGRKSILPGICNTQTVKENHSHKAVAHPKAAAGILEGNPIHEDMLVAAKAVNVQFILNVTLDNHGRISGAFAGDLEEAHAKGVEYVRSHAQQPVVKADIVITSNGGYPLDQNLYQSPKAIATAQLYAKEGGVIIMCCSCCDGMGGEHFARLITMGTPEEIERYLASIPPKETIPEQWCAQIYSRILRKHTVIIVSTFMDEETINKANMMLVESLNEALKIAYRMKGENATVTVIPNGVSVLAVEES